MFNLDPPEFMPLVPLTAGAVQLWLLDMAAIGDTQLDAQRALLTADEVARARRFVRGDREHVATRILLRRALSYYTGIDPAALCFVISAAGKPSLALGDYRGQPLAFNLSHSGKLAILAVGLQPLLGVDIEAGERPRELLDLAERYYHPAEFAYLRQLNEAQIACEFFRLWTLKEAFFKALGGGIVMGLERACFTLKPESTDVAVSFAPELNQTSAAWQFVQTRVAGSYECALAVSVNNEQAGHAQPLRLHWLNANELLFS